MAGRVKGRKGGGLRKGVGLRDEKGEGLRKKGDGLRGEGKGGEVVGLREKG